MFLKAISVLGVSALLASCSPEPTSAEKFMERLSEYCGNAYAGKLVSTDDVDAGFAAESIVMHVRDCSNEEIRIPLHVGENRSRTWIVSQTEAGLRLKHDHRHEDGHADDVNIYGGDSSDDSSETKFVFPVDDFSKAMFDDAGIPESSQNT